MMSVCTREVYVKFCSFILFLERWVKSLHNLFFISCQNFKSRQTLSQTHHTKACQFISQTQARPPIKSSSLKKFQNALDEQGLIQLTTNILYTGQTKFTKEANHGTADEEIARAKQRAYQPRQQRRPSSKSVLVVARGEGRSTREVEVIWWADMFVP